jgi:hypothetical protein
MGSVYEAIDRDLDRPVRSSCCTGSSIDPDYRSTCARGRLALRLSHPNVCVHDLGQRRSLFVTMELLRGRPCAA